MPTISLCMIVKNEEKHIARCLDSVAGLVDEIVIVDTGSSDRTVEIASRYTPRVYSYPWKDDFSDARNHAFSKATMDYCMWMDADDVLEEAERYRRAGQSVRVERRAPEGLTFRRVRKAGEPA